MLSNFKRQKTWQQSVKYAILDLDKNPIKDFHFYFDPDTGKTGIIWLDRVLSNYSTAEEQERALTALSHMCCPVDDETRVVLEGMSHMPIGDVIFVNSMVEVAILVLFKFFVVFQNHLSPQSWVIVDLPPGVGKSFEVERLYQFLSVFCQRQYQDNFERVLITTPTAKTRNAYSFARVLHSQFGLPIRKMGVDAGRYGQMIAEALNKPCK